jgi:hypothetical protein
MPDMMGRPPRAAPVTNSPVYWFVVLEQAKQDFDFERAARALRELERLGVRVSYFRPRGPRKRSDYAA